MRLLAGAAEKVVRDGQPCRRPDETDAVARRVDEAVANNGVIPVTPGNGVVAGEELAANDAHVMTPALGCAAPVDAIPAPDELQVAKLDVIADLEEDGVIREI